MNGKTPLTWISVLVLLCGCGGSGGSGGSGDGGNGGGGVATYTVGGTVSGLTGSGLVLRNNGGDDLPVSASGMFTFETEVANGAAYVVTVHTQPANPTQACAVTNGLGRMGSSNVTNVSVVCSAVVGYSVVHAFTDGTEGRNPYDGVIGDSAGNLYGTTRACGDPQPCGGYGTVFMVDASGNLLTLHTFAGAPTDGDYASGPLTRDATGNLYGTTLYGGNANYGTVFKLDAAGNETVLHHFTGGEAGFHPAGGVLRDSHGNLYGVTTRGGFGSRPSSDGLGTVYRLEPDGTFTTLHRFAADGSEGAEPESALVLDAEGNLYGVTQSYGADGDYYVGGTIFRIDSAGVHTTLHDFSTDGVATHPRGHLMPDDAGNLYGVTEIGGAKDGGTIFRLDPEGEISFLHEFKTSDPWGWPFIGSDSPRGSYPYAGLVGDPTGIVYGTTQSGGTAYRGVVYRFDLESREFTLLHTFRDGQGGFVQAPLLLDSAGDLYGTTGSGGDLTCNPPVGCGTVFRIGD